MEVPDEVWSLVTDGLFYGTSGVLTLVAMYHPNLDFATIYSEYADSLSMEEIQMLGESLLPHERLVAEQVSTQWVMDVHREDMAGSVCQEDVTQHVDGTEPGSKVDVAPPSAKLNVDLPGSEQSAPSPVIPTVDAAEPPQ